MLDSDPNSVSGTGATGSAPGAGSAHFFPDQFSRNIQKMIKK